MVYVGGSMRHIESMENENHIDLSRVCPDCGTDDVEYANEEFYCKKCGLVLD
ncbi:MAG TPA: TFIIB-type zinc ribbon-containing protein [Candidatus Nanoarchaeia archaeon]|nr:TFIIB-type zinc ribbon-containing protein [Candidatus Nanoarchaeia archaeon]